MKKLLRFTSVFVFMLFLCLSITQEAVKAADTVTVSVDMKYGQQEARDMLQMINEFRGDPQEAWYWDVDDQTKITQNQLQPLAYDYDLEKAAMLRAAEIALSFSHTRPNGESCFTAYSSSAYQACGENIAAGQPTGTSVFISWQEKDDNYAGQGHRRNMLSDKFNAIGIGHVFFNGTHYWVQEFGSTSSPNENATPASESTETVTLEVSPTNISNLSLACSKKAISMNAGESTPLPDVNLTANIKECWPSRSVPLKSYGNVQAASVKWTCQNPDIASVNDDGTITAVAAGKTTVVVTCDNLTASCEVTVRSTSGSNNNTGNGSGSNNNNTNNGSGSNDDDTNSGSNSNNSNTNNGSGSSGNDKTQEEYIIIFEANGGYAVNFDRQTTSNQKISRFPNAYRGGYKVNGWYTQPIGGSEVTTDTIFSQNTTVYAHWERNVQDFEQFSCETTDTTAVFTIRIPNRYVQTWQIGIGTSEYSQPQVWAMRCYQTTGILKTELFDLKPDTDYYYYVGYTTNDGPAKSDVMTFKTKKTAEYTVYFQGNGGSVVGQSSMDTVAKSLTALPDARREGYTFDGWYTQPTGGDQISTATIFDKPSTVFAHWKSDAQKPETPGSSTTPADPTNSSKPSDPTEPTNSDNLQTPENSTDLTNPVTPGQSLDPSSPVSGNEDKNDTNSDKGSTSTYSVKKVQVKNVKNSGKGKLFVKWKRNENNKGYRIAYSTKKNFAQGSTKMKNASASANGKTISGLKKGRTYYIRVQAYKYVNGKKQYGSWSSIKKVKIKK